MSPVPIFGISRHRISIDGKGVTTLVTFQGCPLHCRYCLNDICHSSADTMQHYTPESLYQKVGIDNLYFIATHGGVCFGGGEPLLRVDFIKAFRELAGRGWGLTVETSLNVPLSQVEAVSEVVDDYIIDIKDCNPEIYKAYTDCDNAQVMQNLKWLVEHVGQEHLMVRVPYIPNYNTPDDVARSIAQLREMGIENIDEFDYVVREKNTLN